MLELFVDNKTLRRVILAGSGLAAVIIVLFVVLWVGLGSTGVSPFPRLVLSVCLPPVVMAAGFGVYFITVRPKLDEEP
jgi:lipopolysaccharide export LptBFGC system permease protein LptF